MLANEILEQYKQKLSYGEFIIAKKISALYVEFEYWKYLLCYSKTKQY